jgi:hypothetical protein
MKIASVIFILFLFVAGCARRVTQEELIQQALNMRLQEWRSSFLNNCKDKAMDKAEAYVDSFLLANSLETKLDTMPKPIKPVKPEKPVFKEKPDSLKVDPLFKKD